MTVRLNRLKVWVSLNILFLLFWQVPGSAQIQNAPAAPNDSIITARVLEYSILNSTLEGIEPEQILYSLRVLVISSQSKTGQVIKVYSKEVLSPVLFGKIIEANVSFSGYEKGGKYWIRNISSISLTNQTGSCYGDLDKMDKTPALTLEDYPGLFEENAVVVIGQDATAMEREAARTISGDLERVTGNRPMIKKDVRISEKDKMSSNLILLGSSDGNLILKQIYQITDVTKLTEKYPEKNKAVLQILRNPWNFDRTLLIVVGSDEWGIKAGTELLKHAHDIDKNNVTVEWKDSQALFTRTIPPDKYVFLETEKRIEIKPPPSRLMIERYLLTYYFDEISENLRIWAVRGLSVKDKLTIDDGLLVLIGNTMVIEKVMGSGRGVMPLVHSLPFSSRKEDLDFLKIVYLESNGAVYLRCKGKRVILQPKEQCEMSFREDQAIHTITIKNHGLLDKEKIIVE